MKCFQIWKAPACVMFIVGGVVSAFAQAQDADWKFYGGKMQFCFYDNNTMTLAPNGYKVEIICISPNEVDSIGAGRRRHEAIRRAWQENSIQPPISIRYEINCSKRLVREVDKHEEELSRMKLPLNVRYRIEVRLLGRARQLRRFDRVQKAQIVPPESNEAVSLADGLGASIVPELGWTFPAAGTHEANLLDLLCKSPLETESERVMVQREQQQEAERRQRLEIIAAQWKRMFEGTQRARQAAARRIPVISSSIECPSGSSTCSIYKLTIGIKNETNANIDALGFGLVFVPLNASCPSTLSTKWKQRIALGPGHSTVLNIDRYDGPEGEPVNYCIMVTDVSFAPTRLTNDYIARAQDADWKFYGGKMQFCFYDNNSMTPIPRGYDVKIKCIDPDEMGGVDIQKQAWFAIINCTRRMARLVTELPRHLAVNRLYGAGRNNVSHGVIEGHKWWDDVSSVQGSSEAALVKIVCEL